MNGEFCMKWLTSQHYQQRLWQNYEWDPIESSALVSATTNRVAEQQSLHMAHSRVDQLLPLAPSGSHATGDQ